MFLGTYSDLFDSAISPWTTLGMCVSFVLVVPLKIHLYLLVQK